eukprot:5924019-Pyramimonas_sp.AAC.1
MELPGLDMGGNDKTWRQTSVTNRRSAETTCHAPKTPKTCCQHHGAGPVVVSCGIDTNKKLVHQIRRDAGSWYQLYYHVCG